jgi:hypothetical protein
MISAHLKLKSLSKRYLVAKNSRRLTDMDFGK